ncbi:hypothetical protein D6D54_06285 [Spiroplasma poulsonii]|uniref:Uncharacterized protein n=1 Tax=Spiroplasma poulsonii TaxID=2138 RepID=A0A433EPP0_9MOLU|nr:hypothetical protein [Spiroplasma poulsonii]MBW3059147.1 hypothetical protein [Spiroplasma poulsonii]RUP76354.1 hypothetical protein D6D54_06285 [Spiroplasma poulsonii]
MTNVLNLKEVETIKKNITNLDGDNERLNVSLLVEASVFSNILKLLTSVNSLGPLPTVDGLR